MSYCCIADLLIAARSFIGSTQAFLMVFNPVWTDEFAPASKVRATHGI